MVVRMCLGFFVGGPSAFRLTPKIMGHMVMKDINNKLQEHLYEQEISREPFCILT